MFKQAFDIAMAGQGLFGYLDHPFSPRYQYGWQSEQQRLEMHSKFLDYIESCGEVLFLSENEAMNWLRLKDSVSITSDDMENYTVDYSIQLEGKWQPMIEYKGEVMPLSQLCDR